MSYLDFLEMSPQMFLMSSILTLILTIVGYVFKSIAIFTLAKRRGLKNKGFAFVPFLNWLLLGKIVGDCVIFGKRVKNVGLWAFITSLAVFIFETVLNLGYYIDEIARALDVTIVFQSQFIQDFLFSDKYVFVYEILSYVTLAIDIVNIFFEVTIIFALFRLYAPQHAMMYSLISIFINFAFGICLFIIRKNERVQPSAYTRFYGPRPGGYPPPPNQGGYNGYNGYNGYSNQQPKNQQPPKPRNPFPEFGDDDRRED